MERLTKKIGSSVVFPAELVGVTLSPDNDYMHKLLTRLAAYEDTSLMPEEITAIKHTLMGQEVAKILEFDGIPIQRLRELAQAEKDGRLAVAPCKEGDPVWWIDVDWLPGNGSMFHKIASGKFRYAMLDWQNPIYTSQAAAEAALAEMAREAGK